MYEFIDWCNYENLGSFKKLEILPTAWVDGQQYNDLITLENEHLFSIPILAEYDNIGVGGWIQIPILSTRGRSFSETQISNFQGTHFSQQINGIYPSNRKETRQSFNRLNKYRFIARLTEWDNTIYIIGTLERPCTLRATFNSANQKSGLKAWNIQLSTRAENPASYMELVG